jgi:hypothetical protein
MNQAGRSDQQRRTKNQPSSEKGSNQSTKQAVKRQNQPSSEEAVSSERERAVSLVRVSL